MKYTGHLNRLIPLAEVQRANVMHVVLYCINVCWGSCWSWRQSSVTNMPRRSRHSPRQLDVRSVLYCRLL